MQSAVTDVFLLLAAFSNLIVLISVCKEMDDMSTRPPAAHLYASDPNYLGKCNQRLHSSDLGLEMQ